MNKYNFKGGMKVKLINDIYLWGVEEGSIFTIKGITDKNYSKYLSFKENERTLLATRFKPVENKIKKL